MTYGPPGGFGPPQQPYGPPQQPYGPPQQPYGPPQQGGPQPHHAGVGRPASIGARAAAFLIDAVLITGILVLTTFFVVTRFVDDVEGCIEGVKNAPNIGGIGDGLGTARTCQSLWEQATGVGGIYTVLWGVVIAYYTVLVGKWGTTAGKAAVGIRVVDARTGGRIGYGRAFVRYLVQSLSNVLCLAGLWSPMIDRQRRGWHDRAAGDIVVTGRR